MDLIIHPCPDIDVVEVILSKEHFDDHYLATNLVLVSFRQVIATHLKVYLHWIDKNERVPNC